MPVSSKRSGPVQWNAHNVMHTCLERVEALLARLLERGWRSTLQLGELLATKPLCRAWDRCLGVACGF
eukprot:scaffold116133_cov32-Tisochrysis_lutea.AAC.1